MNHRHSRRRTRFAILIASVFALALAVTAVVSAKDRNHDRIPDGWEQRHHLSLRHDQARRDQDRDSMRNRAEWRSGTDPRDADSDGDEIEDGDEGAGKISSFDPDTGVLVIDLFNGDSARGTVTDETEIECENADDDDPGDDRGDDSHRRGRDSGPGEGDGDNSGPGGGDDQGDDGDDDEDEDDDQGDEDEHCTAGDLVPGAIVAEASLEATADGLVYEEVELR